MKGFAVIVGVLVWFYVWWAATAEAWKDFQITGNFMKALACTVILGPIFATISMAVTIVIWDFLF
jgi:hypothetical protein